MLSRSKAERNRFMAIHPPIRFALTALGALLVLAAPAHGKLEAEKTYSCALIKETPFVVWHGNAATMTAEQLAAYCAPILWFSPDEPLLEDRTGKDITIPEPFPFEEGTGRPVVYFRLREVLERGDRTGPAFEPRGENRAEALIHLENVAGVRLDFFFYYPREEGLNAHEHDVESVEMMVAVARGETDACRYAVAVTRTKGKAHGVLWYDNTLESDAYTALPLHILVEEAKHASCTDKNGDGMYTPGYDVNTRINDAWGVRDIIRSGGLFAASWQSWMAKMRYDDARVFPPMPDDSPRRAKYVRAGVYAPDNAVYELRPFPTDEKADDHLKPFIANKGYPDWPELSEVHDVDKFVGWLADESWAKSFSLALRADGHVGVSFMFPFWIVRNFEDPMGGGYILHRIYLTGRKLRDFGYTAVYTASASRWVDPYFAAGFENRVRDLPEGGTSTKNVFIVETGLKFRVNIKHTPFKIGSKLGTDFWGLRLGLRNAGGWTLDEIGYVVEVGAGSF
jgi:hypothetical protein